MLGATNPYHSLTTDGGENGSPTGTSEGSQPLMLSSRVLNGFFESRCDEDPSAVKPMYGFASNDKFFSLPLENREQITKKGNRVLNIKFTLEIQNQKVEGFITYSKINKVSNPKLLLDTKTS